ncbi:MAG TPA: anti-sigma factor, partial [Candidatus Binataceae bacterium]|nr:anti-sigma factor [Candidatus Binataceae bacterium]
GRLDSRQALEVDAHLASGCDDCKRELKALHEAAARLSNAGSWSEVAKPDEAGKGQGTSGTGTEAVRAWIFFGAAIVAAAVTIAINWYFPPSEPPKTMAEQATTGTAAIRTQVDAVSQQVDWVGNKLATLDGRLAANIDLTVAGLSPDSRIARIAGATAAPKSTGIAVMSRAQGAAILQVAGIPPAPDDKEYEVWWIADKQAPIKAGLFQPANEGPTIVSLDLPPAAVEPNSATITLEQRGGSDKPAGALFAKGEFPRR